MDISIIYEWKEIRDLKGTVIIIDIFRAATVEAYLLGKGVKYVLPVKTTEEAFNLKKQHLDYILVGEVDGRNIPGFDFGNSPFEISQHDIANKIIVHRSSQGTQGLSNAINATEVIFGSFVTHGAIKKHLLTTQPDVVTLVAMAGATSEDDEFARYLKKELLGEINNMEEITKRIMQTRNWYLDASVFDYPKQDFDMCLTLDTFDFICVAKKENEILKVIKQSTEQEV